MAGGGRFLGFLTFASHLKSHVPQAFNRLPLATKLLAPALQSSSATYSLTVCNSKQPPLNALCAKSLS